MATFYLIRHGQPEYDQLDEFGFYGFGRDFAPLSKPGISQAYHAAKDARLQTADIIISSPYTRALQTAQIISYVTGIPVTVEVGLHEWIPDLTNTYSSSEESFRLSAEFVKYKGIYPAGRTMRWESLEHMRRRMRAVADRYENYEKVIVIGHGMSLRTLTYIKEMLPGQIVECTYSSDQPDCEYSFC